MAKNRIIRVQDIPITVSEADMDDYICITDMAAAKSENSRAADVVRNWLRNRSTLEFLSTWEEIYNPDFKVFESEHFKKQAGLVVFTPSVSEWVDKTGAIGLFVRKGRYGGTFAHKDIAFEFASAISPVFKLYLIKEFERLKEQENDLKKIEWDAKRFLSKNNYLIQTDAVDVAIPRKSKVSTMPDWPQMNVHHYTDDRHELGVTTVKEGKNEFQIYDMEKTVVDIVFYREKVGIEETKEILVTYLQRKDRNLNRLLKYAELMKCDKAMRQYLEVLV